MVDPLIKRRELLIYPLRPSVKMLKKPRLKRSDLISRNVLLNDFKLMRGEVFFKHGHSMKRVLGVFGGGFNRGVFSPS